ncbi:MAG: hypothetical protein JOZ93_17595 [Sinobacteraceae bacterium]|nr:hypothetical protein [Nevskiaceae bacterium]
MSKRPMLHAVLPRRFPQARTWPVLAFLLLAAGSLLLPAEAQAQGAPAPVPTAPTATGAGTAPANKAPADAPGTPSAPAAAAPATTAPASPVAPASAGPAGSNAAATDAAAPNPPAGAAPAGATEPPADTRALDQEVQSLKKDVVDLNRDLFVLEEELLFPANTQVAVFLSMDVGDFFALDTVTLKIDQKEVINYLYTPREVDALLKGGVHRLYLGNLKVGKHELVAFFSGKGPNERSYKRGATLRFEKGIGAKYLELKINDRQRRQQPEFEIKDWE